MKKCRFDVSKREEEAEEGVKERRGEERRREVEC